MSFSRFSAKRGLKIGRPKDEATNRAMEEIFTYMESSDDCQFTLNELKSICKSETLDNRTIKLRLKLKYGKKLIITEKSGASTFICLVDNHHDILNQAWYEKKVNKKEEQFRVLEAAAEIIREDIQTAVFDNSNYPPPGRMFEDLNNEIPESLTYFVERVILKNKRSSLDHLKLVFCSPACTHCQGRSCSNIESPTEEDPFDSNEATCDTSLLTQFTCTQDEDEEEQEEQEQDEQEQEDQEEKQEKEFDSYDSDD